MADRAPAPQPPIFNLNAYSPAEIKEAVEKVGVKKTRLPFLASFMLAIVAGGEHRTWRALLYHRCQRRGAELRHGPRARRPGVLARAGAGVGRRRRAVYGQQSDRDGVGKRKGLHGDDAAQLAHRLVRQLVGCAWTRRPGLLFPSSRHEWRPHRPVDIEHGGRKDPARIRDAFLQGHSVQRACLPGGLACLCGAVGHRQDRRAHIAGLGFHSGRLRALRGQHVFPAAGVADDPDWPRSADFDASPITMSGIIHNLVPVTLGNIVGGAGLVGAVYWTIYRAAFGAGSRTRSIEVPGSTTRAGRLRYRCKLPLGNPTRKWPLVRWSARIHVRPKRGNNDNAIERQKHATRMLPEVRSTAERWSWEVRMEARPRKAVPPPILKA